MSKLYNNRFIKIIVVVSIFISVFSNIGYATNQVVSIPMSSQVIVNDKAVDFDAYTIEGNNYFKLRDISKILKNTDKQFDVEWNNDLKAINITSNKPYTEVEEEKNIRKGNLVYGSLSKSKIYKDGSRIELKAYLIEGNNYFKLRDLGEELDFGIVWNEGKKLIEIDTSISYKESEDKEKALNTIRPGKLTSHSSLDYEREVVRLVNIERKNNGLNSFTIDENLMKIARLKSKDMADNGYFSHTSPDYGSPFDMMKKFNVNYTAAGENIAARQKTPEAVVKAWMNSPGHRKNILNKKFNKIGVGLYKADDGSNYWTQMFTN